MKWQPTIDPEELEESYTLFPRLKSRSYAWFVRKLLKRISSFLHYPVVIAIPADIEEYLGDEDALRAVRLLNKLRSAGIISLFFQNKHQYGDEPRGLVTFARLKDSKRFGLSGKGADMLKKSATLWPAVGEAVERYAMEFHEPVESEFLDASYQELSGSKVDIFNISGFDKKTRESEPLGFKLNYDKQSQFRWVKAKTLPDREDVWAPLQWFSFSHIHKHCKPSNKNSEPEPLLSVPITTGVAAGQTTDNAIQRGLLEVVERDAFIIYWLNQIPADRINTASFNDPRFDELQAIADKYRLETHLLYLRTDVPVHTVSCIIVDRSGLGPAVIVGAKTSHNLIDAAYGALADTLAQRGQYRLMMDNEKCEEWLRAYDGSAEKMGHEGRIYFWFQKERLRDIERFISGKIIDANHLPKFPQYNGQIKHDTDELLKFFQEKEYEVFYRELLNDRMKKLTEGLSVTMVRVPKMQPVYLEEAFISKAGERLWSVPEILGYKPLNKNGDDFCKLPHPFP